MICIIIAGDVMFVEGKIKPSNETHIHLPAIFLFKRIWTGT